MMRSQTLALGALFRILSGSQGVGCWWANCQPSNANVSPPTVESGPREIGCRKGRQSTIPISE